MQKDKICSFFGHREIEGSDVLSGKLYDFLETKIKQGYNVFCFGGFGEFDALCWRVVTQLKVKYPNLKRVFYLYNPQHQRANKRPAYLRKEDYEQFIYLDLQFDWWYTRIYYRNIAIIEQSDFICFYVKNEQNSGAYKTYKYALKKKKEMKNFACK